MKIHEAIHEGPLGFSESMDVQNRQFHSKKFNSEFPWLSIVQESQRHKKALCSVMGTSGGREWMLG